MYKIDKKKNNILKLDERSFSDLKIREREHLQEWIAKNPEVLGELLIIQKEYDGFNDTNERLDLLALDKDGGLVIIENKLDDTGRHVVWQALKYTSYCSTLTTDQIIKLYQEYLNKYSIGEDANELLFEFLDWEDDELLLNNKDQRIIFVANNYRKEVTSTVLWLLNHDIQVQCFRATPYSMEEELFLQIEQIIPLPETAQFMIDAKAKEKEDKGKSKKVLDTERLLVEFWTNFKQDLVKHNISFIENVTAKKSFHIGTSKGKGEFNYCIGRKTIRVELYINQDKALFDAMFNYKDDIKSKFDGKVIWQRLDNKKASRIKYEFPAEKFKETFGRWRNEEENVQLRFDWFRESMIKFYEVINPYWEKVQK